MLSAQMRGKAPAIEVYCGCTANWLVINSTDADLWTVVAPARSRRQRPTLQTEPATGEISDRCALLTRE
jgi:hypothetical protein